MLMRSGTLESWCITCSKRLRESGEAADECQLWLRRLERLGVDGSDDYRRESEAVQKLQRNTANARELPANANQEDPSGVVGTNEAGHLAVEKIRLWVKRVQDKYPYVQAVRRVRKDPKLRLAPSRVLELSNISQHVTDLPKIDKSRIIPAVLDESYCIPGGTTVLRINILLSPGTTLRQRECAMEQLKKDLSLFGDG
jgi:hypothetical protein